MDKSIDLSLILNNKKSIDLSLVQSGGENSNYKQGWYKKNTKKVKNYNKDYYNKHKEELRKKALRNYNTKK